MERLFRDSENVCFNFHKSSQFNHLIIFSISLKDKNLRNCIQCSFQITLPGNAFYAKHFQKKLTHNDNSVLNRTKVNEELILSYYITIAFYKGPVH